jgi:hypothetical protein
MNDPRPVTCAAAAAAGATTSITAGAAAITPAAVSATANNGAAVERALIENTALIASILSHHNRGRHACAAALLARLQRNLAYVASVADAAPPPRHHRPRGTSWPPRPSQLPHPSLRQPPPRQPLVPTEQLQQQPLCYNQGHELVTASSATVKDRVPPDGSTGTVARPTPHRPPHQDRRLIQPVRFWTERERELFEQALAIHGGDARGGKPDLKAISRHIGTRTPVQVRSYLQKWLKRQAKSRRAAPLSQDRLAALSPSTDGAEPKRKDAIHTRAPVGEGEAASDQSAVDTESRNLLSEETGDVTGRSVVDARATVSGAELLHGLKDRGFKPSRIVGAEVREETDSAVAVAILRTASSADAPRSVDDTEHAHSPRLQMERSE